MMFEEQDMFEEGVPEETFEEFDIEIELEVTEEDENEMIAEVAHDVYAAVLAMLTRQEEPVWDALTGLEHESAMAEVARAKLNDYTGVMNLYDVIFQTVTRKML